MLMKTEDIEFDKLVAARLREKLRNGWIWNLASDEEILKACEGTVLLSITRLRVAWSNLKLEIKNVLNFSIFKL